MFKPNSCKWYPNWYYFLRNIKKTRARLRHLECKGHLSYGCSDYAAVNLADFTSLFSTYYTIFKKKSKYVIIQIHIFYDDLLTMTWNYISI
jgi:hypothetical protein